MSKVLNSSKSKQKSTSTKRRIESKSKIILPEVYFRDNAGAKELGEVYLSDNLDLLRDLLQTHAGKVDLIYLDPPFKTERDFYTTQSKARAYSDKFAAKGDDYWEYIRARVEIMYQLLSPRGALYLHTDYRTSARLKLMLLELFGESNYVNEIIWFYKTGGNSNRLGFAKKHDTIHFCVKNWRKATWNLMKEKSYLSHNYGFKNIDLKKDEQGVYNLVTMRDVWDIPALRGNQPERVDYPTQKPLLLLERIIQASSNEGDLVADFFCGSGTTGVAAKKLNRRYLLVDQSKVAVKTAVSRLKEIP